MIFFAFLCLAIGVWPEPLYRLLPFGVSFVPYTGSHVVTQLQLLLFSGLAFFVMLPFLKRTLTITLDSDWLWRKPLRSLAFATQRAVSGSQAALYRGAGRVRSAAVGWVAQHTKPGGRQARSWPTGSMSLWMLVMLLGYLLLYYL